MGLELLAGGTSAGLMVIYMVVFALVSPLGVAFGILVTENLAANASGHLLTVTILQGLAGGTILYVTFFEVSLCICLPLKGPLFVICTKQGTVYVTFL